ncbi:hypothetical protein [Hymenobacter sp.]|jgi:hypothetical protein|uniref:hypothetical protein n=1 Tax=Hymenobacter sp. TaxID=1898978 RepID=UPI002EDB8F3C
MHTPLERRSRLLLLVILFSISLIARGQQNNIDYRLQLINDAFHQRLESTYKYQQAVVPGGYTAVERSLQIGNKKYLLEYAINDRKTGQQMRENYSLRFINHDTVRVGKAHYVTSSKHPTESVQGSIALSSEYLNDSYFEATNLLITQNFDPLAVWGLHPSSFRSGQWLYARSMQPTERGDTVASYYLLRSRTGDTCQVQLRERMNRQRPWRYTNRLACSWVVELTHRRLTAEQSIGSEGNNQSLHWVRTYRTATDFVETLTLHYRSGDGGPPVSQTDLVYKRNFKQVTTHQSIDTFTIKDGSAGAKGPLTFNIVSTYY